jgi:hypothetical protein
MFVVEQEEVTFVFNSKGIFSPWGFPLCETMT